MTAGERSGGTLVVWLGLSHLLAAAAATAFVTLAPAGLPSAGRLAGGIVAGLAAGLLLSLPLHSAIATVSAALARLARGQPIAPLSKAGQRRLGPLAGLLGLVEALGARERGLAQLRDDLIRTTAQAAALAERNRLARDLHDSIKQQLYAVQLGAAAALARWESDAAGARAAVEDVRRAAQAALAEMAALLRQLRPAPLTASGLRDALAEQCEALAHRTGAHVSADFGTPADAAAYVAAVDGGWLPPGAEEEIFRIAQEALSNIARHARAENASLRLRVEGEALRLEIADDGRGFDAPIGGPGSGYGLAGMQERAAAIGAALEVTSSPGAGTRVALAVPLGRPAAVADAAIGEEGDRAARAAGSWHGISTGAAISALVVLQAFVPRLLAGGRPPTGMALGAALLLLCIVSCGIAWSQAHRASLALILSCGVESPAFWRMRRATGVQAFLAGLACVVLLPGALVPRTWPPYPLSALAVGGLCALLAAVSGIRLLRANEGYLGRLPPAALAVELDRDRRRQPGLAAALLATLTGYYGIYGGFRTPLSWPPSPDLVPDILVALACSLSVTAIVAASWQTSRWRARPSTPGAEAV